MFFVTSEKGNSINLDGCRGIIVNERQTNQIRVEIDFGERHNGRTLRDSIFVTDDVDEARAVAKTLLKKFVDQAHSGVHHVVEIDDILEEVSDVE